MSTLVEAFRGFHRGQAAERTLEFEKASEEHGLFADEQIRGLVQRLFLNGKRQRARQVVFSAVDQSSDVTSLCVQVGEVLARHEAGTTCIVETLPRSSADSEFGDQLCTHFQNRFAALRDAACEISSRLWFLPADGSAEPEEGRFSSGCLRQALSQLRVSFNYTLLPVPGAACTNEAAILGGLCDGVVLLVKANQTRRVAAQRASELLNAAHAKLLGVVLTERRYPIPAEIYKRL
jgi:hypothetical protein